MVSEQVIHGSQRADDKYHGAHLQFGGQHRVDQGNSTYDGSYGVDHVPQLQEDVVALGIQIGDVQGSLIRLETLLGRHFEDQPPIPQRREQGRDRERRMQNESPNQGRGKIDHRGR